MLVPILTAISPIITDLIDRAFPDSEKREQTRLEVMSKVQEQLNTLDLAQMDVNKIEAQHQSLFVAGWRPFIGWICGAAFGYHFILQPLFAFAMASLGHIIILPVFDMDALYAVLGGMLGLGSLRTIEKVRGVNLPWKKQ